MRFDRMTRRCFVAALAATVVSTVSAHAQLGGWRPTLGVVYPGPTAMALPRMEAFMAGVRGAGFAEDQIDLFCAQPRVTQNVSRRWWQRLSPGRWT
jgi:hypothetical protein